MMALVGHFL